MTSENVPVIHRLRLSQPVADALQAAHLAQGKHVESISVLNGHGYTAADGSVTVVVASPGQVVTFPPQAYVKQGFAAAQLKREVRGRTYFDALQAGYTASVDTHDHHFVNIARHSGTYLADDRATAHYFATTIPGFAPVAADGGRQPVYAVSLVLARDEWAARIVHAPGSQLHGAPMRIDVLGRSRSVKSRASQRRMRSQHLRQAPILGVEAQCALGELHAVVFGVGGTGSVAAEVLARLGVGRLTLVDGDTVESSNLNRLQGVGPSAVGMSKVAAIAAHLARCCPSTRVDTVVGPAWSGQAVAAAETADAVFSCVDNNETRWYLDRLCVQYMLPCFDVGVRVVTTPTQQFFARSTTVLPGIGPCGHCSSLTWFARKRPAAFLDAATLAAQRQAGYAIETVSGASDPSLYALNLQAVSAMGQEFVRWVSGAGCPAHSVLHFNHPDGRLEVQRVGFESLAPEPAPDCPVCGSLLGACRSQLLPQLNPPAPELSVASLLNL